ncbi:MAG: methylenetetrahydrofolate reductase C-terminal domain-containing protein [Dehalococcoidia bacterium]|nr:methylenetetrahydrofolate reductase C-terminal domain-containing protein [Dehalococcoidia bacterium]
MIVGERKPFDEIQKQVDGCKRLLVLGCGTCVSVCMAGGEKEVELLATQLRMANKLANKDVVVDEATIQRQCDREYIEPILEKAKGYDAVLSLACGAGVQFVAEMVEPLTVMPGLNTRFIGVTQAEGTWAERCRACGDCKLGEFGGICPVAMCAKGILNGPCGGAQDGKCETSKERDCAWVMIVKRLTKQGKLGNLVNITPAKDFSKQSHPARQVNEAYVKPKAEPAHSH